MTNSENTGNTRGDDDEVLEADEVTRDAKGLGAVLGDADRTGNGPVASPNIRDAAVIEDLEDNYTVHDSSTRERYITEDE